MNNYLMLGDTHGDLDFLDRAAACAAEADATIIQVGDWGFLWPRSEQLAQVQLSLERAGQFAGKPTVTMRFIDGNHDWHPKLREYSALPDGSVPLTENVIYQPRGSTWEDSDGTRFLFCGGAPSIDKAHRAEGRSWWPEETISEAEFMLALGAEQIDVLVTHDAPDYPPGFSPKGDPEFRALSARSLEMVASLIVRHKPGLHIHGHWHARYSRGVTVGLAANVNKFNDAILLWSKE